jgi:hypothetical protein
MPRLLGYRERIDSTLYDAFSPKEMWDGGAKSPSLRLFGNKNIGQSALTNMVVAGQLASDQTFVIMTWYARTNVTDVCHFQSGAPYRGAPAPSMDLIRAWDAWVHATTVNLVIGCSPIATRPLSELMGPRMFGSACGNPQNSGNDGAVLAEKMWRRHHLTATIGHKERDAMERMRFSDLPAREREIWLAAAAVYPFTRPIIVPTRQSFSVQLYSDPSALTALLKILPENIAPRPLVWIHLDGLLTRDVS